jgi:hypothetical protein
MTDDPFFRDFEPPAVPARLREDALEAARAALAVAPRPDIWARLHASRAARLAWAASIAILAAAHVLLPRSGAPDPAAASPTFARTDPELASIARLPRIDEHALPALEGGRS